MDLRKDRHTFLNAATHLYKRVCPSVDPPVPCLQKSSKYAVKSDQNVMRALEKASSDPYCPCSSVAASVGRVSGLVYKDIHRI